MLLLKGMSPVFKHVVCQILTGRFDEQPFDVQLKIPGAKEKRKYTFKPNTSEKGRLQLFFKMTFEKDPQQELLLDALLSHIQRSKFSTDNEISELTTAFQHLSRLVEQQISKLKAKQIGYSYFDCEMRVEHYKQQAKGCPIKCQFCGRKCELDAHSASTKHHCHTVGHHFRVFGGGHVTSSGGSAMPSLERCDGMKGDTRVKINN